MSLGLGFGKAGVEQGKWAKTSGPRGGLTSAGCLGFARVFTLVSLVPNRLQGVLAGGKGRQGDCAEWHERRGSEIGERLQVTHGGGRAQPERLIAIGPPQLSFAIIPILAFSGFAFPDSSWAIALAGSAPGQKQPGAGGCCNRTGRTTVAPAPVCVRLQDRRPAPEEDPPLVLAGTTRRAFFRRDHLRLLPAVMWRKNVSMSSIGAILHVTVKEALLRRDSRLPGGRTAKTQPEGPGESPQYKKNLDRRTKPRSFLAKGRPEWTSLQRGANERGREEVPPCGCSFDQNVRRAPLIRTAGQGPGPFGQQPRRKKSRPPTTGPKSTGQPRAVVDVFSEGPRGQFHRYTVDPAEPFGPVGA